jgi:hypothetical protein
VVSHFLARHAFRGQTVTKLCAEHALGQLLLELSYQPRLAQHTLRILTRHLRQQLVEQLIRTSSLRLALARRLV